ncbi:MAG: hypothetical protein HQ518_13450 [Rhodopirellula sp.]|nr:hypothetical protein [Rhodopirellula sp.]
MVICFLAIVAIVATSPAAMAQESTRSHRLLGNGLPTLSGGQSQMELLRRLQMLTSTPPGKTAPDSPLADADAMRRLQQAMQSLQGLPAEQQPEPRSGQPGQQPAPDSPQTDRRSRGSDGTASRTESARKSEPQDVSSVDRPAPSKTNSPADTPERSALQRIAERMGLSLDGLNGSSPKSGSPGSTSSPPGLPPSQPDQDHRPGERSAVTDENTSRNPSQTPRPGLSDFDPEHRSTKGRTPGGNVPGRNTSGSNAPSESVPGQNRSGRSASTPNRPSAPRPGNEPADSQPDNPLSSTPPAVPPKSNSAAGSTAPDEPPKTSMQALLDWLKNRDQSASNNAGAEGQPGTLPGNLPSPPDRSATASRGPASDETPTSGNSWFPGGEISPPKKPSRTPGSSNRNEEPGKSPTDAPNEDENQPSPQEGSLEDQLNAQRKDRLDEVRNSSKSLREKLVEIAKLARSESNQSEATDDDANTGTGDSLQTAFVDALAEATKGLAEQVDEIVTEDRFSQRGRDRRRPRRERETPFGQLAGFGNRASEWLAEAVEPELPPASSASLGLADAGPADFSISSTQLLALLAAACLIFWLFQQKHAAGRLQSRIASRTSSPTTLNNRQDIVQAFHDLASRCPIVVADWWTHDRAAQALATSQPDADQEVWQLARLYEQARYLPDESSLTDEQLAAAKAAWLRCRKS